MSLDLLRYVRLAAAVAVGALIAACIAHQMLQVVALALPFTRGEFDGESQSWANLHLAGVYRPAWDLRVPSASVGVGPSATDSRSTNTRTKRSGFSWTFPTPGSQGVARDRVDVHYLPWAPRWAIAAPGLSALSWLFLLCVGLPLFCVLAWPKRTAFWFIETLRSLPLLPRKDAAAGVLLKDAPNVAASTRLHRRKRFHPRRQ